ITPGAKPALLYALLATVGPGDEVLVPDPGFSPYTSQVRLAGATPVAYPAGSAADRVTPRTRAIILNSPANPTGVALGLAELIEIADLAERHDLIVITDEIYARIWFGSGDRAPSIAQLPGLQQRSIIVDGFSKAWRMTGWRLGHAVVPQSLRTTFERIVVNAHSCVPGFVQHAGVAALAAGDEIVATYVNQLRARRDTLVAALNALPGVECATPQGAFYAFPSFDRDDVQLQLQLLETAGVATLAGSTFGSEGAGHLRLSFAASTNSVGSAIARLSTLIPDP
ncbi:MAG TPA: aminotransferase class I/II-fold pyridoxal phosphate-dependent enzyme, partial [Gemmatimonadales bacterium]|nr:aminotransferase class I/II-fold pyridoxal phosphate-dependent enzyme [Gemmatimonadales bacterium]